MFVLHGKAAKLRRGLTRRDCLRVGVGASLGVLGSSLVPAAEGTQGFGKAKSCIFVYLFGGPSHLDIWDMKPAAPPEIRGEFRPIDTNVPGIRITEHLPRLSRLADQYALIRSLSHGDSAHGSAGHTMMTGFRPRALGEVGPNADDFPHYGAVLAKLKPTPHAVAPFVQLPHVISTSTAVVPGQNAGFLGRALDPFRIDRPSDGTPTFAPPLLTMPVEVTQGRMEERIRLLEQMEATGQMERDSNAREMDKLYRQAFRAMDAPETKKAFALDREPAKVRERYGLNVFGQSLLLARRLVEAGVRMVTVVWPDRTNSEAFINNGVKDPTPVPEWDTHGNKVGKTPNFPTLRNSCLPALDLASSALLEDLTSRGLLDQTLVIWTGEFGRSPRVNGDAGRDHYGNVFSAMLAGGGVRGGQVYGASDKHGAFPADRPVSAADFAATLYHSMGLQPDAEMNDRLGRPQRVCTGQAVTAIL
jgi:Protein of unknown function (DUF1501)